MEIGTLCVKTAGRDSRKKCVIIDILEGNFVTIDGETRRRKCNILHLEPLNQILDIKKGASHADVISAFKKIDIELKEKKSKPKTEKPRKLRKADRKPKEAAPAKKPKKKPAKKEALAEKVEKETKKEEPKEKPQPKEEKK